MSATPVFENVPYEDVILVSDILVPKKGNPLLVVAAVLFVVSVTPVIND